MEHEALIRVSIFLGIFAVLALIEVYAPRRARQQPRRTRWITNWGIVILSTLGLRALALAMPLLAVGAALDAEANGWGLMNQAELSLWLTVPLTVVLFDLAIWAQHLVTHKVPILWRLHRVHHADRDFDVTTAIRFHPVEIALSMLWKIGLVYLLGPPAIGIVVFEIVLNGTAMFNHANIALPPRADALLRKVIVTPDMHRVHHSIDRAEHDRNYGFALSIWDRLFGTYLAQPKDGHQAMTVGLEWQDDRPSKLGWSLWLPFRRT
ncbi:sterol desaturase family protein [Roseovarius sp. SCSIO 43702]|uniref:sterol desaturase family protein n=1 Tax=Roseovarius sp. SCSIO 43702 TaxID=2823043 RepID=UPI001C72B7D0|nr:sterol desaturase family protein [Roseovarius sp. SCSIO 43702]QYX56729.1 sterol desaturase family protein [Roseovarius sp. SCSIO 43702]